MFVVGLVDNLIRPLLIKGGTQVHGALMFFSIIGGAAAFGAIGLLFGPVVLTLFLTAVRIARSLRTDTGWGAEEP